MNPAHRVTDQPRAEGSGDGARAPAPSFEAVFRECSPYVWRVVRSLGVRDADVEDVCQEAFLVVHRRLATFEGKSSVRTWVYGICIRVASDYRKRAHHKREQVVDEVPEAAVVADQDHELEQRRALAWLDGVLDTLDESKRAAFVLSDIEEVPMSEIAEALSCPLQTAYARVYAARRYIDAAARREKAKRS